MSKKDYFPSGSEGALQGSDLNRYVANKEREIAEYLERFDAKSPPLDPGTVDYDFRNPDAVREQLGHVLDYGYRIETEVARNVAEIAIVFHQLDPNNLRFIEIWEPQEVQHGIILGRAEEAMGRTPSDVNLEEVSTTVKIAGILTQCVPLVERPIVANYLVTGASTEKGATSLYSHIYDGLVGMGEKRFADTGIAQIKKQEPGHFGFYRKQYEWLRPQMSDWDMRLARGIKRLGNPNVFPGATNKERKASLGRGVLQIVGDDGLNALSLPIERLRAEMLEFKMKGGKIPRDGLKGLEEAVELAQHMDAQAA